MEDQNTPIKEDAMKRGIGTHILTGILIVAIGVLIGVQIHFVKQLRQPKDEITLTSYYPSPQGDFKLLTAEQIGVGKMYADEEDDGCGQSRAEYDDPDRPAELAVDGKIYAADDVCSDVNGGRCMSQGMVIGGFYFTRYKKGCMSPNPLTKRCTCPAGYKVTGFHYVEPSQKYVYWLCWK